MLKDELSTDKVPGELIYYAHILDTDIKVLELPPTSDVHYGNHLFAKNHFKRHVEYILNKPNCRTILNGDLCESTIKSSKGDIFKQVGTVQDQWHWITEQLFPIKDKILGITSGNHENRIYNETGIDVTKEIARELNVPYRPEGMLLKISFGDGNNRTKGAPYTYWIYFTHGYGGARTTGAKSVKVERTSSFIHADVYCMSHDHVSNAAPVIYLVPDSRTSLNKDTGFRQGKIKSIRKLLVKTNAYVKWGGYSEVGGYSPTDLTTPIIYMQGEGKPLVRALI
jgi:hypothetical protein